MSDVFAPQPVRTKTAGDVVVNINSGQTVGVSSGAAVIGKVGIDQTTPGTTNAVQVISSLPAGANLLGKTGIDQTTPGTTNGVQLTTGSAIAGKFGIDQTTPGTTNGVQVNAALPAGTNIVGKFGIDQTTPGTTNGVQVNAGTALIGKVGIDQTTPGTTNGVQVNAALPAGTNLLGKTGIDQTTPGTTNGVQVVAAIPAGANIVGKVGIDQTTPGTTNGVQINAGSAIIGSLVANQSTNTVQLGGVAIATGSGTTSTGTQRVILATDQATIPVSFGLIGTASDSGQLTSVAVAAGATVTLDGVNIPSGTGKFTEGSVSSSVSIKAQLGTWNGTTFTVKRTFFVQANTTLLYEPARNDLITMTGGTTADFRWSITNNDNLLAADVYASVSHVV